MEYPIYIDGENAGTLHVEQQGLYTRFFARFADPGRLIRLCVYGGGKTAVLGVAMPENGELYFERKFSRVALGDFPENIEYAAAEGELLREPKASVEEEIPAAAEEPESVSAAPEAVDKPKRVSPEPEREKGREDVSAEPKAAQEPAEKAEPELIWYSRADGSLTTLWEGHSFVAVPLEFCEEREGMLEQRTIEGREYAVFEGQSID